jgi:hypothetical protein
MGLKLGVVCWTPVPKVLDRSCQIQCRFFCKPDPLIDIKENTGPQLFTTMNIVGPLSDRCNHHHFINGSTQNRVQWHPMIVDAPSYVMNTLIWRDLQIPSVKEEISHYSSHYSARLTAHPNDILLTFLEPPERKHLRRHLPNNLPTRFMVQFM